MRRFVPLLVVPLLAAACQPSPQRAANEEKRDACRSRIDQASRVQDRAARLLATDQRSTPFASGFVGNTSRGLSQLYGRDRAIAECVGTANGPDSTGPAFTTVQP